MRELSVDEVAVPEGIGYGTISSIHLIVAIPIGIILH